MLIDIQPYIDKLDKLREYMDYYMDIYCNALDVFTIYKATGMILYRGGQVCPLSFEQWLKLNTTLH